MKRKISIILSIVALLSVLTISTSAFAEESYKPINQIIFAKSYSKPAHFFHVNKVLLTVNPTCVSKGYIKRQCIICKKVFYEYIRPNNNHNAVIDPAVPATCSQTGLTGGSHCSFCGKIIIPQEEIMMLDCDLEKETVPATPEKDGYYREYCKNCDYDYTQIISRPKTVKLSLDMKSYTNEFQYTGREVKPYIKVQNAKGEAILASYYRVKFSNNINVGTATVTINFDGDRYDGVMTENFIIKEPEEIPVAPLQATSIIKLQSGMSKNSIEIYHTCSENSTAYDVQYSTSSSFSGAKTIRVKSVNNGSFCKATVTVAAPKGTAKVQKQYYVRIRAVDTENNLITKWSQPMTVNIYVQN